MIKNIRIEDIRYRIREILNFELGDEERKLFYV